MAVSPTLIFPNGQRISGTPDEERLREVLSRMLGTKITPNKVWYLEQNRLFHGVPLKEIEKLAHLFHEYDYAPKQIVFGEGDLGDAIYLLKTGHVRLYKMTEEGKEITFAILGPGDVFGELALFDETHRHTFAETIDAAHICATSVNDFTRLMAHRPQLTMMVAREIARRRQAMETRLAGTAYGTIAGRLKFTLRHLAREHGTKLDSGATRIDLRLSHQELANMVGTTRETCTLELGKLQRQGALGFDERHRLLITDVDRLQAGPIDKLIKAVAGTGSGAI